MSAAAEEPAPWQESAACLGVDPDVFFPEPVQGMRVNGKRFGGKSRAEQEAEDMAKAVCATCSQRQPCRAYADAMQITEGVWGGEAGDERRKRWRREMRRNKR